MNRSPPAVVVLTEGRTPTGPWQGAAESNHRIEAVTLSARPLKECRWRGVPSPCREERLRRCCRLLWTAGAAKEPKREKRALRGLLLTAQPIG